MSKRSYANGNSPDTEQQDESIRAAKEGSFHWWTIGTISNNGLSR